MYFVFKVHQRTGHCHFKEALSLKERALFADETAGASGGKVEQSQQT